MSTDEEFPLFSFKRIVGHIGYGGIEMAEMEQDAMTCRPRFVVNARERLAGTTTTVFAAGIPVEAHVSDEELELTYFPLCVGLALRQLITQTRLVVGVSGPAGAGKSVMSRLFELLYPVGFDFALQIYRMRNKGGKCGTAAVALGVDGYHRRNEEIQALGLKLFKGRPDTFDVASFTHDVNALKHGWTIGAAAALPAYNRNLHEPEAGQIIIEPSVGVVLVEGILLFTEAFGCREVFDLAVWLDMDEAAAKDRVTRRKVAGGRSHADADEHYDRVDGPNHRDMVEAIRSVDVVLHFHTSPCEQWLPRRAQTAEGR